MSRSNDLEKDETVPVARSRLPVNLVNIFPFLGWLPDYRRDYLPGDILAALTVGTMIIPQSMAYALLAGLPPIVGLYTGILPMLIFGLMGSTTVLTLGPTAITSVITLTTLSNLAAQGSPEYMTFALTLTLTLGVIVIVMGVFRLGAIVNLLSQSVLAGHMNAAALIILFSQIPNILGIKLPRSEKTLEIIIRPLEKLNELNPTTLAIGVACLVILIGFKNYLPKLLEKSSLNKTLSFVITRSGPLVVVVFSTLTVALLKLNDRAGVRIVGAIPAGLPRLAIGTVNFSHMDVIFPGAIAIAFVGFMEGVSTAKNLNIRRRQRLNPNQELIAMGLANLGSFVSGGYVSAPSISRSAVNYSAGANTGLSSVIGAGIVALVVTFFTPLFYYLPQAALASIIMISVSNLVRPQMVLQFRRYSKGEPIPFIVTFLGAFFVSLEVGLLLGIAVSAGIHLWRTLRPPIIRLERIWNTTEYRDAVRYYDQAQHIRTLLIYRPDESLYFANVQYLEQFLRQRIAERPKVKYLILECSAINTMDASAIEVLTDFADELGENGVELYFAGLKDRVRERVDRVNFSERVGTQRFYRTTHEAVLATGELPDEDLLPI
ncbi:MAG TPA: sulfate permease [Phototrophicaceae bacterium]|nr:sulfate permease [Phototrophicaceae bacterium]